LTLREQVHLELIGFEQAFWDEKHLHPIEDFPEHCRTPGPELPADVQVAVVHLRMGLANWDTTWFGVSNSESMGEQLRRRESSGSDSLSDDTNMA
jgi:hypothetical protein